MIPVTKYHGCGNDFIITDWELLKHKNIEDFVKHVCDRHTGIGADGCILVKQKPLEMVFYNADGSRAPMCGNGIRCFAKYCYDEGIETAEEYDVETLAGSKHVTRVSLKPFQVRIDMGTWDDDPKSIQVDTLKEPVMGYELCIGDKSIPVYSFFMSTVHTVVFVSDAFAFDYNDIGHAICHHPLYREQTNVNFVQIVDAHTLQMVTYERGVGMTLACGTGACAAARIAHEKKGCAANLKIILKRGELHIDIDDQQHVHMFGPAERILKGEVAYV